VVTSSSRAINGKETARHVRKFFSRSKVGEEIRKRAAGSEEIGASNRSATPHNEIAARVVRYV